MRVLRWMCRVAKLYNIRNERKGCDESGGNRKESSGKEVEVVRVIS